MRAPFSLALPSKGRLMQDATGLFAAAGMPISKLGDDRGYKGIIAGMSDVEVTFLSATEIAYHLREGTIDMGISGEDLLREHIPDLPERADITARLGFGGADVVCAVPECWIDVSTMSDLDEVSVHFYEKHQRRLRVATKYVNVTRGFFADHGVRGYRIVESLGATEGAPSAGAAEAIVDITSTGETLRANHLRVLDDGLVLRSEAVLARARHVHDDHDRLQLSDLILDGLRDTI
jgi:ATP phosphoribosyltransferase